MAGKVVEHAGSCQPAAARNSAGMRADSARHGESRARAIRLLGTRQARDRLAPPMRDQTADRSRRFTESVIREMTRLCQQHGGVNLAQGFPDFPAPDALKDEVVRAVRADINQYAITWGAKRLRDALVAKTQRHTGLTFDPE